MKQFNTNFDDLFDVDYKTGTVRIKGTDTVVPSLRYDQKLGEIRSYGVKSFEKRSADIIHTDTNTDSGDNDEFLTALLFGDDDDDTKPDRDTVIEVNGKLSEWDGSDILKTIDHHTNYRISSLGYVMNSKGKIMSSSDNDKKRNVKHQVLRLYEGGKGEKYFIHRLVAEAFIPNPENLPVVHHIDHNPLNNRVDNLMWMSKEDHTKIHEDDRNRGSKEKWQDPEFRERQSAAAKANWKDAEYRDKVINAAKEACSMMVEMCNPDTMEVIQTFPSANEAARVTGFNLSAISAACRGIYSKANGHIYKGFYWRYKQ